jgi:hypothetical protein
VAIHRWDAFWLLVLAWHVALEYRTGGGQDESWHGVAGSMVLRGGGEGVAPLLEQGGR